MGKLEIKKKEDSKTKKDKEREKKKGEGKSIRYIRKKQRIKDK